MGILGSLISTVFGVMEQTIDREMDNYESGYSRGSKKVANMSDAELESRLKYAKEHGVSGWSGGGATKAMLDEYERRKEG